MDIFLGRLTSQAMNYAIRSGITITTSYAIKQCAQLLKETSSGSRHREELQQLQARLESKIRILSPAIDMIELISARGNTTLKSAVVLTKAIRADIQKLGTKTAQVVEEESLRKHGLAGSTSSKDSGERGITNIISTIKALLARIEDAIPLINLAITMSGVNLSTKLSGTISPSRLLQASTFLTAADTKYTAQPNSRQQVGPTWTLSVYMLFTGHANRAEDEDGMRDATWKEVMHKAKVNLMRVPLEEIYELSSEGTREHSRRRGVIPGDSKSTEFAYQLVVIEDLDDDRVHTFDNEDEQYPGPFEDVLLAGIRDVVPVHEISKIFYADTGKILNIGDDDDVNNPVLLLKRDVHADEPRMMIRRSPSQTSNYGSCSHEKPNSQTHAENDNDMDEQSEIDAQLHRESTPDVQQAGCMPVTNSQWRLPVDLDPEWIAFEVYTEAPDSESDAEEPSRPSSRRQDFLSPDLTNAMSHLKLKSSSPQLSTNGEPDPTHDSAWPLSPFSKMTGPRIKTSLSLLEMLIKLAALQQFRQDTHLAIEDELLNFFLEDSATAGAGPDKEFRQRLRHDAVRRVGFDPYDESPVKRRGEEYIAHKRGKASPRQNFDVDAFAKSLPKSGGSISGDQVLTPEPVIPSIEHGYSSPAADYPSPSSLSVERRQLCSRNSTPTARSAQNGMPANATAASSSMPEALPSHLLSTIRTSVPKLQQVFARAESEPRSRSPLTKELVREDGYVSS